MFEVEYKNLSSVDATNRFISLDGTPVTAYNVALDTIGGTAQFLDGDFYVDGTSVRWDDASYNLYSQLGTGDNLRIIYDRS